MSFRNASTSSIHRFARSLALSACLSIAPFLALASAAPAAMPDDSRSVPEAVSVGSPANDHVPDRYIVVFREEALQQGALGASGMTPRGLAEKMTREIGGKIHFTYGKAVKGYSATLSPSELEAVRRRPEVLRVEPVIIARAAATQTGATWGLDRVDQRNLPLDGSYIYPEGAAGVHAYILDTGIRSTHNEFSGRVVEAVDFVGDGFTTEDCNGHGTHVAGTLGGETYGVAKDVIFHNLRIFRCNGSGTSDIHIAAMEWLIDHHINPAVANMSIEYSSTSSTVDDTVRSLVEAGVTVVAAAGNFSLNACTVALANVSRVITVGSTTATDTMMTSSNFGSCVDLFAPGNNIVSAGTKGTSSTAKKSGTSMAAPHVAGAAALYLAAHPTALPGEVEQAILGHATSGNLSGLGSGSPNLLLMARMGEWKGSSLARGDFNCDGVADLAIGMPGDDIGSEYDAGAVEIYFGSSGGFAASPDQTWSQDSSNVDGTAEAGDRFGSAMAASDFNSVDECDDLAIGAPGDSINGAKEAGAVTVLFGSSSGLSASADQRWHQDSSGVQGTAESANRFGTALASGDFDNDGYDDLAIGAPGDSINSGDYNAGAVTVLYGSSSGLTDVGNQRFHQDNLGLSIAAEDGDLFGATLATGDFDGDGRSDLLIGAPGEGIDGTGNAGMVVAIYGTSTGLLTTGAQAWHQDTTDVEGAVEPGDRFGASLSRGDFDGDGRDDAAIGVPGEDIDGTANAGMVNVLYGLSSGLSASGDQSWHQGDADVEGSLDEGDRMGCAVTAGDFNDDGYGDLAIGSCGENATGSGRGQGMVNVLYGTSSGLSASGDQKFAQGSTGVSDSSEAYDFMGAALVRGDFNGDGIADLAIGVPLEETTNDRSDTGAVNVLFGTSSGLDDAGNQFLD